MLTCSVPSTLQVRVGLAIAVAHRHLALAGRSTTVRCAAGKPVEVAVRFKLSRAAKAMLAGHGATVALSVRAFATGAGTHSLVAHATVHGTL